MSIACPRISSPFPSFSNFFRFSTSFTKCTRLISGSFDYFVISLPRPRSALGNQMRSTYIITLIIHLSPLSSSIAIMTTVLVTGASGFIAQHIVKLLISKNYSVVGTVRLSAKGDKLKANLDAMNAGKFEYSIVPDIAADGAFDKVFTKFPDISVVLHTASPFFYDTTDPEKDLVIPAIRGTENIMNAIKAQVLASKCNIKRVVITSSDAAIYSSVDEQNAALSFDETSWNNISYEDAIKDPVSAYYGAKSFAEKAAWKIAETPGFPKVSAVNPVWVFGPQAFDNEVSDVLNTSNEMIHILTKVGPDGHFENDKGGFVDVRDVAKGHLAAFEEDYAIGKRLYMKNGEFSMQMMLDAMNKQFPQLRGKIPVGTPGSGSADILTLAKANNAATRELLGIKWVSLEQCVSDILSQLFARKRESSL